MYAARVVRMPDPSNGVGHARQSRQHWWVPGILQNDTRHHQLATVAKKATPRVRRTRLCNPKIVVAASAVWSPSWISLLHSIYVVKELDLAIMAVAAPSDQIRQMVNFILQEAHEKANEIRVKVSKRDCDAVVRRRL
jgi:hypothetical protein